MSQAMVRAEAGELERVLIGGDLSRLTADQRVSYYNRVCESVGLNPLTKPFEYLKLNGKEILYARRDCTDQLRSLRRVSIAIVARDRSDDVYVVTARATTPDGRCDESTGAVALQGLRGENLANALMKAETKAKRRVTLSICGLGMLDETEMPGEAVPVPSAPPVLVQGPRPAPVQVIDAVDGEDIDAATKRAAGFVLAISEAQNAEALALIGGQVKAARLPAIVSKPVREAYAARKRLLEDAAASAVEPAREPGEEG